MYFPLSVSRARVWLGVCLLLCLCALSWPTHAGVLLAVVSERAAPTALAAARRHLAQHPQDRVLLRTPAVFGVTGEAWERKVRGPLSGRLGHGRQWRSWIHIADWVAETLGGRTAA